MYYNIMSEVTEGTYTGSVPLLECKKENKYVFYVNDFSLPSASKFSNSLAKILTRSLLIEPFDKAEFLTFTTKKSCHTSTYCNYNEFTSANCSQIMKVEEENWSILQNSMCDITFTRH